MGEPPLYRGASDFFALREALVSARRQNGVTEPLNLDSQATADRLRLAVGDELVTMGTVVAKEGRRISLSELPRLCEVLVVEL